MKKQSAKKTLAADTVEARCIRLVDDTGKVRVSMTSSRGSSTNSITVIALLDDEEKPRLELQFGDDEAGIVISDPSGKATISIVSRADGQGMLLEDSEGTTSITLAVENCNERDRDGSRLKPRLELADRLNGQTWHAQDQMKWWDRSKVFLVSENSGDRHCFVDSLSLVDTMLLR